MSTQSPLLKGAVRPGGEAASLGCRAVLVVSPNAAVRRNALADLDSSGWSVIEATSGADALQKLDAQIADMVVMDPNLPDLQPEDFHELVRSYGEHIEVVPIGSARQLVDADLSQSPQPNPAARVGLSAGPAVLEVSEPTALPLPGMIGASQVMQRVSTLVRMVAPRTTTVLITGESGTGKDLVARAVHSLSQRSSNPFVVINCAAIPEALLEAELFGYVKGAFTGALQSRVGRVQAAQGGTLFLDEIGELPLSLQAKLLRFLEQGEIQRLGSSENYNADVRIIAATNASLREAVEQRRFREDLFYRLSVFPLEIAPLRTRMEDVRPLATAFLSKFSPHRIVLTDDAVWKLERHAWPGNIRELRNVMERASILAGSSRLLTAEHIVL